MKDSGAGDSGENIETKLPYGELGKLRNAIQAYEDADEQLGSSDVDAEVEPETEGEDYEG